MTLTTERLSDPVGWQYRVQVPNVTGWSFWHDGRAPKYNTTDYEVQERQVYSQEYVTTLQRRAERIDAMLTESVQTLKSAEQRIAELEAKLDRREAASVQPYGYLRENDGQIQISIGPERPHDRSGGYATPWSAIYAMPPKPIVPEAK
ncbi:hypothetical protein [Serratia marcescens]|uniref:hypothetical protein n=1 Tax=Serratia marcescens TaxID=615 RepID=UPI00124AC532|nr:hypothetical protein [Serratia marcescens]KAB1578719.1 hypothetical protein F7687_22555 [Serratia marcescens]